MLPFKPSPTTLPLALFFLLQILQVTGMCDPTREKGKDQATKYKEEKRPKMRRFVRLCWWVRGVQLWQRSWLGAAGWRRPPPGTQETPREHHGGDQLATMPAASPWSPGTHRLIKTTLVVEKPKSESLR